uniref:Uncharacterized protein n=1 Tax=Anguilla anguilla TaxID=7936 RepID=A0A0E9XHL4_ANGAN
MTKGGVINRFWSAGVRVRVLHFTCCGASVFILSLSLTILQCVR